jgi:hypothetical protein
MRSDRSLRRASVCNLLKGRQLPVEFGDGLFQHLTVAWITGSLQLLGETLAGKKQALAFLIALLFSGGDWGASRSSLL